MGNNTNQATLPTMGEDTTGDIFDSYNEDTYTTVAGETINSDGYSHDFLEHLNNNIQAWVNFGGARPDFYMTKDEIEYVQDHMEQSSDDVHFTRVEPSRFFERGNYKVGDVIQDEALFRSFSRTSDATLKFIEQNKKEGDYIAIFRTSGVVDNFNATRWANKYGWEEESFVNPKRLQITNIQHFEGKESLPSIAKAIDVEQIDNDNFPRDVYVIDVKQI